MKKNLIIVLLLLSVAFIIMFSCPIERDIMREPDYTKKNKIYGFSKPIKLKLLNNNLYIMDKSSGIYKIDLTTTNLTSDSNKSDVATLIYSNDNSGDIVNFDITNDYLYLITYKSEYYYIVKQKLADSSRTGFKIPSKLPAFNITFYDNYVYVSGNFNMSLGVIHTDKIGDPSADQYFHYSKNTYSPKEIVVAGSSPYKIYVSSTASDEIGIETYNFNDPTIDALKTDLFPSLKKYPFHIKRVNDNLYFTSYQNVTIFDISNPDSPTIKKSIPFDTEIGIFDVEIYNDKLACLYGYQIKPDKYTSSEYELKPYYSGIKIISNPMTSPSEIKSKEIFIEGWCIDFVVYNNFVLSANQMEAEITINKIE